MSPPAPLNPQKRPKHHTQHSAPKTKKQNPWKVQPENYFEMVTETETQELWTGNVLSVPACGNLGTTFHRQAGNSESSSAPAALVMRHVVTCDVVIFSAFHGIVHQHCERLSHESRDTLEQTAMQQAASSTSPDWPCRILQRQAQMQVRSMTNYRSLSWLTPAFFRRSLR